MLDRQTEVIYAPRPLLQVSAVESVLCVAPHPDDEIFGCGGLLGLLAANNSRVTTVILTRGDSEGSQGADGMAEVREKESRQAAEVLGLTEPLFHNFVDRKLVYAEPLIAVIENALNECKPQYLLLPSVSEPHPDHQAVALAGMAAAQRSKYPKSLLFYEVGAPLQPNLFVDITVVAALKWQAVAKFCSQLGIEAYEPHARAFAALRAFGLGAECSAAEAFFQVDASALRQQGAATAFPFWPLIRAHQNLANTPHQLPLVSVLIRSIDRPQLTSAVASVAVQTYSNIEIVVVNASGKPHSAIQYPAHRLPLRLVEPGNSVGVGENCNRSRAANLALGAAQGGLGIFLDDDDLIDPHHIERLVSAMQTNAMAAGAYAGVRVEGVAGVFQRNYDLPWSRYRLNGINFLPIHAVMFRLDWIKSSKLDFDETLPVLEDWDFWCKLAALGPLVHCPGISAIYRQGEGDSKLGDPDHPNHWKTWHAKMIARYVSASDDAEVAKTLAWHAIELDRVQANSEKITAEFADALQAKDIERRAKEDHIQRFSRESQAALLVKEEKIHQISAELGQQLALAQSEVRVMRGSLSWRITAPLRWIRRVMVTR